MTPIPPASRARLQGQPGPHTKTLVCSCRVIYKLTTVSKERDETVFIAKLLQRQVVEGGYN